MTLSAADSLLLESMKQRELTLKRRQRAASAIYVEARRYRLLLVVANAVFVGAVFFLLLLCSFWLIGGEGGRGWLSALVGAAVAGLLAWIVGPSVVGYSRLGRMLLRRKDEQLNLKYSGDLYAGQRWAQFYYRGEEISPYIGQILYLIDAQNAFDSVDDALAFAKAHSHVDPVYPEHGLALFNEVADQTNLMVLSSTDAQGKPSTRYMGFVRTERPGVWYAATAPDAPKVHELDLGRVALITSPTAEGATITSNRLSIRRAEAAFDEIVQLYREQLPRYLEGMTEDDQRQELVYEITLATAKVDTWVDHGLAVFDR